MEDKMFEVIMLLATGVYWMNLAKKSRKGDEKRFRRSVGNPEAHPLHSKWRRFMLIWRKQEDVEAENPVFLPGHKEGCWTAAAYWR